MGSRIQCFMLEPTDRVRLKLRRYNMGLKYASGEAGFAEDCPGGPMDGHDASKLFLAPDGADSWPARLDAEGILNSYQDVAPAREDARWPTTCEQCGHALDPRTHWQVFQELIYRRTDTGSLMTLRDAPPGAMWDAGAPWDKGPDGRSLHVSLPPNGGLDYWCVDGPAKGGGSWTRTGEPPLVTANPSILTPRYHGFLRNGWLEEC